MKNSVFGKNFSLKKMRDSTTLLRLQESIIVDGTVRLMDIKKIKKYQLWNYLQFIFTINRKNDTLQKRYNFGHNSDINEGFLKHIYDKEHLRTKHKTIQFINTLIKTHDLDVYDSVDEYDKIRKLHEAELQECRKLKDLIKNMKIEIKPNIDVIDSSNLKDSSKLPKKNSINISI